MSNVEEVFKLYGGNKYRGSFPAVDQDTLLSKRSLPHTHFSQILELIKDFASTKTILREIYLDETCITFVERSVSKINKKAVDNG